MEKKHNDIVRKSKEYTLASWQAQSNWEPISMVSANGVYFWDGDGKRYLDWSSQLMNVNIGHGNKYVIEAIKNQADKLCYAYPNIATEPRGQLGEILSKITPHDLNKSFFTTAGTDAVENAMKIARLFSGRQKILTRFRSYHGGTFGSMTAGGDPRGLANEPGVPWIRRFHGPDPYRSPIYRNKSNDEGDLVAANLLEQTILFEGPEYIAAILLEGYSGSSGIYQGGKVFWSRIQEICDKYDILLIIDEVMSGFGRTGKWFGINHQPQVKPDIMVMAKGLTSGYIPLGAVTITERIAAYFEKNTLWAGLTYSSHALACATAIATIEVYNQEKLIDRSYKMGQYLHSELEKLKDQFLCVGDLRGTGMFHVIDLVKNRKTREAMSPFNSPLTKPMQEVAKSLRVEGLSTFVRWNWIFCTPPLIITKEEIDEGISIIERALLKAEKFYK